MNERAVKFQFRLTKAINATRTTSSVRSIINGSWPTQNHYLCNAISSCTVVAAMWCWAFVLCCVILQPNVEGTLNQRRFKIQHNPMCRFI